MSLGQWKEKHGAETPLVLPLGRRIYTIHFAAQPPAGPALRSRPARSFWVLPSPAGWSAGLRENYAHRARLGLPLGPGDQLEEQAFAWFLLAELWENPSAPDNFLGPWLRSLIQDRTGLLRKILPEALHWPGLLAYERKMLQAQKYGLSAWAGQALGTS